MARAKRGNGEGSIYSVRRNGRERWVAAVTVGRRPDGRPRVKSFQRATKREAIAARDEYWKNTRVHAAQPGSIPLDAALDRWLEEDVRPRLRPRTHQNYEQYVRLHIKPALGDRLLGDLKSEDIDSFLKRLGSKGPGGKPLSPTTVRHVYRVLNTAFKQFLRWRLITTNEVALVRTPSAPAFRPSLWTVEQARDFLAKCPEHEHGPAFGVLLLTGLRISELLGLTWDCVNFADNVLRVDMTLQRIDGQWVFQPAKTAGSHRLIPLPAGGLAAQFLQLQFERQQEMRRLGTLLYADFTLEWLDRGLVFTTSKGRPMSGKDTHARFQALLRKLDLPKLRQHDLRHLFATLTLASGTDLKATSSLLGHTTISVTADLYGHVLDDARMSAMERLGHLLEARPSSG